MLGVNAVHAQNDAIGHLKHSGPAEMQLVHVGEGIQWRTGLVPPDAGERIDSFRSSHQSRDVLRRMTRRGDQAD